MKSYHWFLSELAVLDFVIADETIKPKYVKLFEENRVRILSSEYVIQSLIQGKKVDPDAHPKYAYDHD